ncbi:hypothetical protein H4582DRAFT_2015536, partial [Lactarius indigo]
MITGNCDDEGSLFSLSTIDITQAGTMTSIWPYHFLRTSAQMEDYLKLFMFPDVKDSEVDLVLKHYSNDQRAGCPFDTGIKYVL